MFGAGISREGDILDLAADIDVVMKSGAWYNYEGNKIGQGRENAKQYLREHPEVLQEISAKVRAHYGFDGAKPAEAGEGAGETAGAAGTDKPASKESSKASKKKASEGDAGSEDLK